MEDLIRGQDDDLQVLLPYAKIALSKWRDLYEMAQNSSGARLRVLTRVLLSIA